MKQLTHELKSGDMKVQDVPPPMLSAGMVLVRNHYSAISAGTESSTVRTARKNLLAKAKERPEQVAQVIDVVKQQGPVQAYRAVKKRLEAHSPLGYSCAGEVMEVAPDVVRISAGDLVACAGAEYAHHAEVVAVPVNLCVKLAPNANLKNAAYNTLGAIALQGIRQAGLQLGETAAVIGLGLIGQLTCLMLRASGVRVVGIDIDRWPVEFAEKHCADLALERSSPGILEAVRDFTGGLGVDAAIITAGTSSLDPINVAGQLCRKKGKVVVVGAVPTGFEREDYYRKELELRMSCSYGPGRYDPEYEEKGVDYPAAYVRWTERRNMNAFQELLERRRIDVEHLTTHVFPFDNAADAYDLILTRREPYLGILLEYDAQTPVDVRPIHVSEVKRAGTVCLAFVGAGSYAQSHLLPHLPRSDAAIVRGGVMTLSGTTSKGVAQRFGFEFCTSREEDIFENDRINTVFIATRHDSHARYVLKAIRARKHVFVEKPLAINAAQLEEVMTELREADADAESSPLVMVGFNRRFAPLARMLKEQVGPGPMSMLCRVNAGAVPADSWLHDKDVGGGRIVGEVCHFIDFLTYLNGSLPRTVFATSLPDPRNLNDVVTINLSFENGSIGSVSYFANGAKSVAKEYIEVYRGGVTATLRDFRQLEIHGSKRPLRKRLLSQDKGQQAMVRQVLERVKDGGPPLITLDELEAVTLATLQAVESIRQGRALPVLEDYGQTATDDSAPPEQDATSS
ncbi:bi-domain-containing oxidoreductase [Planctomycetota bacterium]